jgi:hypothetical protein
VGYAERQKKLEQRIRRERRFVWFKAVLGFLFALPMVPLYLARECYRRNEWPWQ